LAVLKLVLLSTVIGSLSGTSAAGPSPRRPAQAAAWSSSSGRPGARAPLSARFGTFHGEQPSAGSTNRSSSPLSLPLTSVVAPSSDPLLAAVSCAICPFPVARYSVVTLSLWSWSMREKLRVVRHVCPSLALPGAGTVSLCAAIAVFAAVKNAGALHAATWVNGEKSPLMFSPPTQFACCRIASWTGEAAGVSPPFPLPLPPFPFPPFPLPPFQLLLPSL